MHGRAMIGQDERNLLQKILDIVKSDGRQKLAKSKRVR